MNATQLQRRGFTATMAMIMSLAVVGFFLGIRQQRQPAAVGGFPQGDGPHGAPLARTHEELSVHPWGSASLGWSPEAAAVRPPVGPSDAPAKQQALAARDAHRAFEGAPPTIPHPVGQASGLECQSCHRRGAVIGTAVAPPYSHQTYTMCTQCHVPEVASLPAEKAEGAAAVSSTFVGARGAAAPYRWTAGSPPQIPHTTLMRTRCNSCHGPKGRPGLQTPHPERLNCTQCHAPSASLDQRSAP